MRFRKYLENTALQTRRQMYIQDGGVPLHIPAKRLQSTWMQIIKKGG